MYQWWISCYLRTKLTEHQRKTLLCDCEGDWILEVWVHVIYDKHSHSIWTLWPILIKTMHIITGWEWCLLDETNCCLVAFTIGGLDQAFSHLWWTFLNSYIGFEWEQPRPVIANLFARWNIANWTWNTRAITQVSAENLCNFWQNLWLLLGTQVENYWARNM